MASIITGSFEAQMRYWWREQGWGCNKSTRLLPGWLVLILTILAGFGKKTNRTFQFHMTFQFQTSTQMLVTFVGSLLCSERLSPKTITSTSLIWNLISHCPRNGLIFAVLRSHDPDTRLSQTSRDWRWPADKSSKRNEPYFEVFLTSLFYDWFFFSAKFRASRPLRLKIQRKLCHPKFARKVSGLPRNGPQGRTGTRNLAHKKKDYCNTQFLEIPGNNKNKRRKLRHIRCL